MTGYQLAEVNIALAREPLDAPLLADFMAALDTVPWWVRAGHRPSVPEAEKRLEHLGTQGPTPAAFTFGRHFDHPEAAVEHVDDGWFCPA